GVGAGAVLAPPNFGGSTTYVSTHGISMEPSFHTGDLALVRSQSSYRVGQIVAYRSHLLHTIVLHRIVARDGARYVFKGDNNSYRDPEHPTRDQLVGALWLHVPHGGMDIAPLRSPWALALVAGVAVLLLFNEGDKRRRRRRGGRPPATPVTETAAIAFGGLLLVSLIATIVAFAPPTRVPSHRNVAFAQRGAFAYPASTAVGPVYPTGAASTGDPLFTSLVHRARVSFHYKLASLT